MPVTLRPAYTDRGDGERAVPPPKRELGASSGLIELQRVVILYRFATITPARDLTRIPTA
jgi:hypothetical protein